MKGKHIPNILTTINLVAGVMSLVLIMAESYNWAAAMVLFATIMDSMDGRVARRLQVASDFGKELDSLSDLVSFGVAPAILAYATVLVDFGIPGLAAAVVFVICGALRLARFNSEIFTGKFQGVPITVAGGLLALVLLVSKNLNGGIILVMVLLLAWLMVSKISVPKF
ncbi:CDP-diacylglycerol--serine O-phosphatidyltransferase [Peptococcaceae bacterium 1198_IL3148]